MPKTEVLQHATDDLVFHWHGASVAKAFVFEARAGSTARIHEYLLQVGLIRLMPQQLGALVLA